VADSLFERDGDGFVATELARGPWDPDSCHAGAPAALLAALIDTSPSLVPMQGVRLTYEILRPVPLGPVTVALEVTREGKRVQLVDALLRTTDGVELVRCRGLRVRRGEVPVPDDTTDDLPPPSPGPEGAARAVARFAEWGVGFWTAVDVRPTLGDALGAPGPGTAWFRLEVPIADDVPSTPLARVAAAADYGNGIAPPLAIDEFLFVNPDLTLDVHRLPDSEWVALESRSVAQRSGVGLTTSTLFDERGRIGTAMQSLYIEAR
jgi:hypothetical protein